MAALAGRIPRNRACVKHGPRKGGLPPPLGPHQSVKNKPVPFLKKGDPATAKRNPLAEAMSVDSYGQAAKLEQVVDDLPVKLAPKVSSPPASSSGGDGGGTVQEWRPRWQYGEDDTFILAGLYNLLGNAQLMWPVGRRFRPDPSYNGDGLCPPQPDSMLCVINNVYDLEEARQDYLRRTSNSIESSYGRQYRLHLMREGKEVSDEPVVVGSTEPAANEQDNPPWDDEHEVELHEMLRGAANEEEHGYPPRNKEDEKLVEMYQHPSRVSMSLVYDKAVELSRHSIASLEDNGDVVVSLEFYCNNNAIHKDVRMDEVTFNTCLDRVCKSESNFVLDSRGNLMLSDMAVDELLTLAHLEQTETGIFDVHAEQDSFREQWGLKNVRPGYQDRSEIRLETVADYWSWGVIVITGEMRPGFQALLDAEKRINSRPHPEVVAHRDWMYRKYWYNMYREDESFRTRYNSCEFNRERWNESNGYGWNEAMEARKLDFIASTKVKATFKDVVKDTTSRVTGKVRSWYQRYQQWMDSPTLSIPLPGTSQLDDEGEETDDGSPVEGTAEVLTDRVQRSGTTHGEWGDFSLINPEKPVERADDGKFIQQMWELSQNEDLYTETGIFLGHQTGEIVSTDGTPLTK